LLRRAIPFLSGLLLGLLCTALLQLLLSKPRGYPIELQPPPTCSPLQIHVAGAVISPGVYTMPIGSIVQHAIDAAGGPREDAFLDAVNLAAKLVDGQQVYISTEDQPPSQTQSSSSSNHQTPVVSINVNAATAPELERLPGIGPSLAQKIIDCRDAHGPFLEPDDLLEVSGIGPSKLDQIRDLITFR
jgi:competence protein ComEA